MPRAKKLKKEEAALERETVTVTLLVPHVHAGVFFLAGNKIEIKTRQVEWLRAQKVIA